MSSSKRLQKDRATPTALMRVSLAMYGKYDGIIY